MHPSSMISHLGLGNNNNWHLIVWSRRKITHTGVVVIVIARMLLEAVR